MSESNSELYKEIGSAVQQEINNELAGRNQTLADMKAQMRSLLKEVEILSSQIQITQEMQKVEGERSPEKPVKAKFLPT